eukprot:GSChrysophyteH1.ASY1.ANO1.1065.1 assembled CDS
MELLGKFKFFASKAATSVSALQVAQSELLSFGNSNVRFESGVSRNGLNYVVVTKGGNNKEKRVSSDSFDTYSPKKNTLLLLHGYGAGLGMFYQNYGALVEEYDQVIAVDWLGMGGSARVLESEGTSPRVPLSDIVKMALTGNDSSAAKQVQQAEDFFCDSLHHFVQEMHEEKQEQEQMKIDIAAHSLGGYLAFRYMQRHCTSPIRGLILVSPCGIPNHPPADKQLSFSEVSWGFKLVRTLWALNVTPQQLIRLPYWGSSDRIATSLNRRFRGRWQNQQLGTNEASKQNDELQLISKYLYEITVAAPSGEYALNSLLTGLLYYDTHDMRVYARSPIQADIAATLRIPTLLLFGDNDWMAFDSVEEVVADWQQSGVPVEFRRISQAVSALFFN